MRPRKRTHSEQPTDGLQGDLELLRLAGKKFEADYGRLLADGYYISEVIGDERAWLELIRARAAVDGLRVSHASVYDGHSFLPVIFLAPHKGSTWPSGRAFPGPYRGPPRNRAQREIEVPFIRTEVLREWGETLIDARARAQPPIDHY
jgi:hypothetical protein